MLWGNISIFWTIIMYTRDDNFIHNTSFHSVFHPLPTFTLSLALSLLLSLFFFLLFLWVFYSQFAVFDRNNGSERAKDQKYNSSPSLWEAETEPLLWQSLSPCFRFASIYCQWDQRCHYQPSGTHYSVFSSPENITLLHLVLFLSSFCVLVIITFQCSHIADFWKSYFILKCLRWSVEVVFNLFFDSQRITSLHE